MKKRVALEHFNTVFAVEVRLAYPVGIEQLAVYNYENQVSVNITIPVCDRKSPSGVRQPALYFGQRPESIEKRRL